MGWLFRGSRLSEMAVWFVVEMYAEAAGLPVIAPHDLRRTCVKLCRAGGGELEQVDDRASRPHGRTAK